MPETIPAEPMPAPMRRLLESAPDPAIGERAADSYRASADLMRVFIRDPMSARLWAERLERAALAELADPRPAVGGFAL